MKQNPLNTMPNNEWDLAEWWEMAVVFAEKSVIILLFFLKGNPI